MNTTDPPRPGAGKPDRPPRRRKWLRRLLIAALLVAGLLVVANGPGFRLLAKRVLAGKLGDAGLSGEFELGGSFLGGLTLREMKLSGSGPVRRLDLDRARVDYQPFGLLRGRGLEALGPIELSGLTLAIAGRPESASEPRKPLRRKIRDVGAAWETIGRLLRLDVSASDVDLRFARADGGRALELEDLNLRMAGGEGEIGAGRLQIGGAQPFTGLRGQLRASGAAEVELTGLALEEGLAIERLRIAPPDSPGGFPIARGQLAVFGGTFGLAPEGEELLVARLEQGAVDVDALASRLGLSLPVTGELTRFATRVAGRFEDPDSVRASGSAAARAVSGFGYRGVEAATEFLFEEGQLFLDEFALRGEGSAVSGAARIMLSGREPGQLPEMRFDLDIEDADLGKLLEPRGLQVEGGASGRLGFRVGPGGFREVSAGLSSPRMQTAGLDVRGAALKLRPDGAASEVELSGGFPGDNQLVAEGRFDFAALAYTATADGDLAEVGQFAEFLSGLGVDTEASGSASVSWSGRGSIREGDHHGEATVGRAELRLGSSEPVQGSVVFGYSPGSYSLTKCDLRSGALALTGNLRLAEDRLEIDGVRVRAAQGEAPELASIDASLPFAFDTLGDADRFFAQPGSVRLELRASALEIAELFRLAGEPPVLTGALDTELDVGGVLADLTGGGVVRLRRLNLVPEEGDPPLPPGEADLSLKLAGGRVSLDGKLRHEALPAVTLRGAAPLRLRVLAEDPESLARQSFDLSAECPPTDLSLLRRFVPQIAAAEGTFSARLHLAGTAAEPRLSGRLAAAASRVRLEDEDLPSITDLELDVALDGDRAEVRTGRVRLAGGRLELAGGAHLDSWKDPELALRLSASEALLYRDEYLSLRANGDLALDGPLSAARLSGRLGVVHSQFVREIEILPIGLPRLQRVPAAPRAPALDTRRNFGIAKPPFSNWTLDLRLGTDVPFQVRSNLARATVLADLRLTGTGARPVPAGEIWLGEESVATLPFSELRAVRGKLQFDAATGFDPRVDFVGVSRVREHDITIRVYERLSAPRTLITSDPPLPEEDAVALLATGRRASEFGDGEVIAGTAAGLLFDRIRRRVLDTPPGEQRQPFGEKVDIKPLGIDPKTGNRAASATVRLSDRVFLLGGIDATGEYRGLLKVLVRVK